MDFVVGDADAAEVVDVCAGEVALLAVMWLALACWGLGGTTYGSTISSKKALCTVVVGT